MLTGVASLKSLGDVPRPAALLLWLGRAAPATALSLGKLRSGRLSRRRVAARLQAPRAQQNQLRWSLLGRLQKQQASQMMSTTAALRVPRLLCLKTPRVPLKMAATRRTRTTGVKLHTLPRTMLLQAAPAARDVDWLEGVQPHQVQALSWVQTWTTRSSMSQKSRITCMQTLHVCGGGSGGGLSSFAMVFCGSTASNACSRQLRASSISTLWALVLRYPASSKRALFRRVLFRRTLRSRKIWRH
mmetsp:Transcript_4491/g.12389  ORF Transcript_4491/g.12389 Transcript_4491/m.12389 type:complete len:244 (-) Transcript_4491:139-870(-)